MITMMARRRKVGRRRMTTTTILRRMRMMRMMMRRRRRMVDNPATALSNTTAIPIAFVKLRKFLVKQNLPMWTCKKIAMIAIKFHQIPMGFSWFLILFPIFSV